MVVLDLIVYLFFVITSELGKIVKIWKSFYENVVKIKYTRVLLYWAERYTKFFPFFHIKIWGFPSSLRGCWGQRRPEKIKVPKFQIWHYFYKKNNCSYSQKCNWNVLWGFRHLITKSLRRVIWLNRFFYFPTILSHKLCTHASKLRFQLTWKATDF